MLVSKVRERDLVGNKIPADMALAEARAARLELLSQETIGRALSGLNG
jgi:hypothetical protein